MVRRILQRGRLIGGGLYYVIVDVIVHPDFQGQKIGNEMLAARLDTVKVNGITANLTLEDQLTKFMAQFQSHIQEQPALIDISNEEIIRWNPDTREKAIVTAEEFENEAELDENIEANLAVAEIFQAGYLELCGVVYCLACRGLPMKYL